MALKEPLREEDKLTDKIIGAAIEIHRVLGPGLLESAYHHCLAYELKQQGLSFETEKPIAVVYKGQELDCDYRLDFLVEGKIILELKAVEAFEPIHHAQLLTYLKLTQLSLGLLLNFNVPKLKIGGMKRVALNL